MSAKNRRHDRAEGGLRQTSYSPSLCSPVADPWENVVDRDIIRLAASRFFVAAPASEHNLKFSVPTYTISEQSLNYF